MNSGRTERYRRLDNLKALQGVAPSRFRELTAAVVGVGNVGGQVAYHLALMGFSLILIDNGMVEAVNLGTQGFYESDKGCPKVAARAEQLRRLNPDCRITPLQADISLLGAGHLSGAAVLFSCLDSWQARGALHEMAWELSIPLVDIGLDGSGSRFYGRVASYDPRHPQNACMFCSWDRGSFTRAQQQDRGAQNSCPEIVLGANHSEPAPTAMPGSMGAVVAGMAVITALKMLFPGPEYSTDCGEILVDLTANHFSTVALRRNPDCVFPHRQLPLRRLIKTIAELTVRETFEMAAEDIGPGVVIELHRKHIAPEVVCNHGHQQRDIYRVVETFPDSEQHCGCGSRLRPDVGQIFQSFNAVQAQPFAHKTWQEVGLGERDIITVRNPDQAKHYLFA